jgi:hypothetical protein
VKLIRQHDSSDCAAVCIAMVASAYGKNVSVSLARRMVGTDRDGATLYGLVAGAKSLGFRSEALHGTELSPQIPTPCIVHVLRNGEPHFVVVKRVSSRRVLAFDPAEGRRWIKTTVFQLFRATIESSEMQRGIPRFCNAVFPGIARAIVRPRMGRLPLVEEPPTNKGGTIKDAHNGSTTKYSISVLS